ncbi:PAS domain-containing protein [Sporolactobacillus sp. CPB3-1]|uniref:PAS domain-containing protein n=1 Tax=Sporolactobacillus mangiferae TaxID=2940498 RepID=A0ABT0MA56_9BACL|nr:PAS domain-containing protein [Sporolactobacillus mangiferae]MCL1631538.1 PAS domain-containing protein [Sporolactobacillus mangiferae]
MDERCLMNIRVVIFINAELAKYKDLVAFLGEVLGDDTEIILHDVTDLENSVVAISETNLSGRDIGSPVTNLILKMLKEGKSRNKSFITNYEGIAKDGTVLRSSTFFIRNDKNEIIGMLCINIDYRKMEKVIDYLSKFVGVKKPELKKIEEPVEHLSPSIEDLAKSSIKEIVGGVNIPPERMSQEERLEIIEKLNENGIFLLKGIVSIVAEELCTSEASIYRYLSKVKKVRGSV